ncbi:FLYWCH zinc finger domain-containing protein [Phthorimaea operculella]|nr:FLYWCH zinc finger domain-containing protein [Phthorimaea operculella]
MRSINVPGCKGKLKLTDGRITDFNNNDDPVIAQEEHEDNCEEAQYAFIRPLKAKHDLLLYGGYTFSQQHSRRHWYCSKKKMGCKARVRMTEDQAIVFSYNQHIHPPPLLQFTEF